MKKQLILFLWAIVIFTACETKSKQQNKITDSSTPTIINLLTFDDVTKDTTDAAFVYNCKVQYNISDVKGKLIYESKEFNLPNFRNDAIVSIDFSKLTNVDIRDDNRIEYNIKISREDTIENKVDQVEIKGNNATFDFILFRKALHDIISSDNKNNITVQKVKFGFAKNSNTSGTLPGDINPPIKPRETP